MLGIVVALPIECRTLTRQSVRTGRMFALTPQVRVCVAGMGADCAIAAAERLRHAGARALLNWGCAAALVPTLRPGCLLLPDTLHLPDGRTVGSDSRWRQRLRERLALFAPVTASLAGSASILATPQAKRDLRQRTGADAADMESAFLAAWARTRRLPFAVIRAIADDAETPVPPAVLAANGAQGGLSLPRLLAALLRHPGQLPALLTLGRQFAVARSVLNAVAASLIPLHFAYHD